MHRHCTMRPAHRVSKRTRHSAARFPAALHCVSAPHPQRLRPLVYSHMPHRTMLPLIRSTHAHARVPVSTSTLFICRFMAPELLSSEAYPASDVWAAGVMAYQLLSGYLPFDDHRNPDRPALSLVWCAPRCATRTHAARLVFCALDGS